MGSVPDVVWLVSSRHHHSDIFPSTHGQNFTTPNKCLDLATLPAFDGRLVPGQAVHVINTEDTNAEYHHKRQNKVQHKKHDFSLCWFRLELDRMLR